MILHVRGAVGARTHSVTASSASAPAELRGKAVEVSDKIDDVAAGVVSGEGQPLLTETAERLPRLWRERVPRRLCTAGIQWRPSKDEGLAVVGSCRNPPVRQALELTIAKQTKTP